MIVGALLWWAVKVRRDPLAHVPARPNRLMPESVLLPVIVWLLSGSIFAMVARRALDGDLLDAGMIWSGNAAQIVGGSACLWVAAKFFDGGTKRFLLGDGRIVRQVVVGVGYLLASLALCAVVLAATAALLSRIDPHYYYFDHQVIDAVRGDKVSLLTLWIGTVLIAPIAEELFFRGILQTCLENLLRSRWITVVLTGAIFGAIHAGAGDSPQPHVVPALMVLGVMLSVLYLRTGSLVAPIVLHSLFNTKTLLWETLSRSGAA